MNIRSRAPVNFRTPDCTNEDILDTPVPPIVLKDGVTVEELKGKSLELWEERGLMTVRTPELKRHMLRYLKNWQFQFDYA